MVDGMDYAIGGTLEGVVSTWENSNGGLTYDIDCSEVGDKVDVWPS